ncbi:uncharacterized protein LOC144783387 [Lissotriton helveticus]
MKIFQRIGSMFQTPSQLPDNAMAQGKGGSLPGGKRQSGPCTGALVVDGRTGVSKISKQDIGAPCDFKHVAHVPWESRFATYIVNPDLQTLFSRAGVREEDLKDRRTSKRIFEILERKGGMVAVRREALNLALSVESRSRHSPSETSCADHSRDPMSAQMLPPRTLNLCPSINFPPLPPSLPSFDNFEVASDPIPPLPLPQALERHTSNSAQSSTASSCSNHDAVDSVYIPPPPPLPPSLRCVADDWIPVIPPPPPLPFVKNQAYLDPLARSLPPPFNTFEPSTLLPLPSPERNHSTIGKYCNAPSSPPCIHSVPVDSTMQFPSPITHLASDNSKLLPQPLNPSQSERSGCLKENRETASEKQMEQPGLLEQIRRGIPLKAVQVDVQVRLHQLGDGHVYYSGKVTAQKGPLVNE